jgi:hypothetical protein
MTKFSPYVEEALLTVQAEARFFDQIMADMDPELPGWQAAAIAAAESLLEALSPYFVDEKWRKMVIELSEATNIPFSVDLKTVFIDGTGEVPVKEWFDDTRSYINDLRAENDKLRAEIKRLQDKS